MKKLVLKTVAITLATIVGLLVVAFCATCFIAPKFLANVFDGVGNYPASVFFYESNYNKTGEIEDLGLLIDKLDSEKGGEKLKGYLKEMIESAGFDEYCKAQDLKGGGVVSSKEYYTGLYAVILIDNGDVDGAIVVANEFVKENGYTKNNPYRLVIAEFSDNTAVLSEWKNAIAFETLSLSGDALTIALGDLNDIKILLENN